MTQFKKKITGICKECNQPVYATVGQAIGIPHYIEVGKDKVCDECFSKNPKKYMKLIKKEAEKK